MTTPGAQLESTSRRGRSTFAGDVTAWLHHQASPSPISVMKPRAPSGIWGRGKRWGLIAVGTSSIFALGDALPGTRLSSRSTSIAA